MTLRPKTTLEYSCQVGFDFAVFDLSKVDDHDQTIHMSIYITMDWFEPRLIIEDDAAERTVVNTIMAKAALWIPAVGRAPDRLPV